MILHRALCGNQIKEPVEYVPISTGWDRPCGHLYTPALHCQHHPNDKISRFIRLNCEIHDLLKKLASTKAQHISLLEGRPVSDSEQGLILHHLRRRLSVSIITAQSRCLLTRLNHMAPAAKEAAKKRAFSKHRQQTEENDRLYHFEAYVKGRRLHDLGLLRP